MKKLLLLPLFALIATAAAHADEPAGYYAKLNGKKDSELKTAVYQLIHNFTQVSSYNDLPKYFQRTDVYPNSMRWWDMYSNIPKNAPSFAGMNREHSFPKSWWGGLTTVPAYVDLNHLYPSEAAANQAKSNYPLGNVSASGARFDNGITKVGTPAAGVGGGSQYVFEPDDEYKGDFARTYFYMVTCYQDYTWAKNYSWMLVQGTYPTLQGWASKMLLEWSKNDPVSDKEKNRNDMVYSIQNNRNPFIDRPDLADYIWGDKKGLVYTESTQIQPAGDPQLITPTQGMALDFGEVAVGRTTTAQLFFRGENLTGSLDLALAGTNKAMFSLPSSSLSTSLVNRPDGTWLTINYTPTETGSHTAKLIISEGGMLGGSRGITLLGECLAIPTLTACTATEATDITSDSYRANWTSPAGEVVDYWIVNRTRYVGGTTSAEEILAEEPGIIIEGFDESDSESYYVQSVRLGYRSPASNVIFVAHNGITGVQADQGLVVEGFGGCLRFRCSAPQTGARIYDVAGQLVMLIDEITDGLTVDIPAGIYLVTTDQTSTTLKVVVKQP